MQAWLQGLATYVYLQTQTWSILSSYFYLMGRQEADLIVGPLALPASGRMPLLTTIENTNRTWQIAGRQAVYPVLSIANELYSIEQTLDLLTSSPTSPDI